MGVARDCEKAAPRVPFFCIMLMLSVSSTPRHSGHPAIAAANFFQTLSSCPRPPSLSGCSATGVHLLRVFFARSLWGCSSTNAHFLRVYCLGWQVDSFPSLWGEANDVVSPASCKGRVVAHVVRTLVLDLFANYRYCAATRRLVKSPVELKVSCPLSPQGKCNSIYVENLILVMCVFCSLSRGNELCIDTYCNFVYNFLLGQVCFQCLPARCVCLKQLRLNSAIPSMFAGRCMILLG